MKEYIFWSQYFQISIKNIKHYCLAMLIIPLNSEMGWKVEKYSNIKNNEVSYSEKGILVKVSKSASPLIYKLDSKIKITGFKIQGEIFGLPQFKDVKMQGEKGFDDYVLRLGLIVPGSNTLTGVKKFFAATWVKQLYSQVPQGSGLDRIQFFNVTQNKEQEGKHRVHPLSELIHEDFFKSVSSVGPFNFSYTLKQPVEAVALWISIDGDDTMSDYSVLISSLEFN